MAPSTRSKKKGTSATPLASTAGPPVSEPILPGSLPPEGETPEIGPSESQDPTSTDNNVGATSFQSTDTDRAEQAALLEEVDARTFPQMSPNPVTTSIYSSATDQPTAGIRVPEHRNHASPVTSKIVSDHTMRMNVPSIISHEESKKQSVEQTVRIQLMQKALALMELAQKGSFIGLPQGNFDFVNWVEAAVDSNDLTRVVEVPEAPKAVKQEQETPRIPTERVEHAYKQGTRDGLEIDAEAREAIFAPRGNDESENAYHNRLQIQADILDREGGIFTTGASALRAEVKGKAKAGSSKDDANIGHAIATQYNALKRDEDYDRDTRDEYVTPYKREPGIVINEPRAPSKPARAHEDHTPTRVQEGRPVTSGLGASSTPQRGTNRRYREDEFNEYYAKRNRNRPVDADVFSKVDNNALPDLPVPERKVVFPSPRIESPTRVPEPEFNYPVDERSMFRISHPPNATNHTSDDEFNDVEAGYNRFTEMHLSNIVRLVHRWVGVPNDTPPAKGVKLTLNAKYSGEDDPEVFYTYLKDLLTYFFFGRISGPDHGPDQVLITGQTLHGPARSWYEYEVLKDEWFRWTLTKMMCELFQHFISPAHVHTPQANYARVRYSSETGVSQFASTLQHYARLLPEYPSKYELNAKFLRGIPATITRHLLRELKLSAELTRFNVMKNEAILYEASSKYADNLYKELTSESNPPSRSKASAATAAPSATKLLTEDGEQPTTPSSGRFVKRVITQYAKNRNPSREQRTTANSAPLGGSRPTNAPRGDVSMKRCFRCRQIGHIIQDCPIKAGDQRLMANIALEEQDAENAEATEEGEGGADEQPPPDSDEESLIEEIVEYYDAVPNSQYDSDEQNERHSEYNSDEGFTHRMHSMYVVEDLTPMDCTDDEEEDLHPSYEPGFWALPRVGQRPNLSRLSPEMAAVELETYHRRRHALQTTREHNRIVHRYAADLKSAHGKIGSLKDQLRRALWEVDSLKTVNAESSRKIEAIDGTLWDTQEALASAEFKHSLMILSRDETVLETFGSDALRIAYDLDVEMYRWATDVTPETVTDVLGHQWSRDEPLPGGLRRYSTSPRTVLPEYETSDDEEDAADSGNESDESSSGDESDDENDDKAPAPSIPNRCRLGVTIEEVPEEDECDDASEYENDAPRAEVDTTEDPGYDSLPDLEPVSDTSEDEFSDVSSEYESDSVENTIEYCFARNVPAPPSPSQNRTRPKDAKSIQRPRPSPNAMMCMTTYGEVNGVQALILFDSGSTCDSITPSLAAAAKVKTVALDPPFTLQLGCIGSRSKVNWGATHSLTLGYQTFPSVYSDIVNTAGYDMILGTPFMHDHKVVLDFKRGVIEIDGQDLKALTRAEAEELKTPIPTPTAAETGENILPEVMLLQTPPSDKKLIDDIWSERVTMQHPEFKRKTPQREQEGEPKSGRRTFSRTTTSRALAFKTNTLEGRNDEVGPSTSG
ncbi:unnamed protein product [Peniophora sp. CBMAI 1063]|nr:unnamed protein product [Peniophora sp. CBMAI 1063]